MPTATQDPAEASPVGLYNRPVLTVDPGMHTAAIRRADVDAAGQYAVTGSFDKTVRIWSVADGHLERTLRLPAGPGNVGRVDAVAISPDGNLVAAGGWTSPGPPNRLYLFDRPTGDFVASINGLPNVCIHLAFSPDGRYLAATLGGANGIRLYDRDQGWAEAARDIAYDNASYWAAFAPDGRLATTSRDGRVRLYDPSFHLVATVETGGRQPIGIAFSPDGERLAIGYYSVPAVDLLDARTLQPLPGPNAAGIDNGNLFAVAWSADGHTLFAAGQFQRPAGKHPVVAWHDSGRRELLEAGRSTVMNLEPLPEGDLLVAAQTPELARLDPDGRRRWVREPPQADFRDQRDRLTVSPDGTMVDFGYELWGGATPARFEVSKLALVLDLPADTHTPLPPAGGAADRRLVQHVPTDA